MPSDKGAKANWKRPRWSRDGGRRRQHRDRALLLHSGMGRVLARASAPSTLGSLLRAFTFGHDRQLEAVASRFLTLLAKQTPLLDPSPAGEGYVLVDVDDTVIKMHGQAAEGAGFGDSGVRGLKRTAGHVATSGSAPAVVVQRLCKARPACHAGPVAPCHRPSRSVSADAAFYGRGLVLAAVRADDRGVGHRPPGPQGQGAASTPSSPQPTARFLDTAAGDETYRGHAIIEQVHAEVLSTEPARAWLRHLSPRDMANRRLSGLR